MARPSAKNDEQPIEFRDPGPPGAGSGGKWLPYLEPLLKSGNRNRWAMIMELDNPQQAHDAARNLTARRVNIPEPTHEWGFASRGCELFAIYRGQPRTPAKKKVRRHPSDTRARRAQ